MNSIRERLPSVVACWTGLPPDMRRIPTNAATSGRISIFSLWRSFAVFDGRCSLKTWTLRVAHNTAASYVIRERRINANLVGLEEIERTLKSADPSKDIDRDRALRDVKQVILRLRPLDRQIIISYLEGMDAVSIADITGLSPANIAMKIHRTKKILAHGIRKEQSHA